MSKYAFILSTSRYIQAYYDHNRITQFYTLANKNNAVEQTSTGKPNFMCQYSKYLPFVS